MLNELIRRKAKSTPSLLDADGRFLTQPKDIADYLSHYFHKKIQDLCDRMDLGYDYGLCRLINHTIMTSKSCTFKFERVSVDQVESLLSVIKVKLSGVDNLDVKLLVPVADLIALPITHIS